MEENEKKKKGKGSKVFLALILAVAVIVGIALAVVFLGKDSSTSASSDTKASSKDSIQVAESKTYSSSNSDGTLSSTEIAAKCKPSVIAIVIYSSDGSKYGEGSGIVMSTDKDTNTTYILTCAHLLNTSGTKIQIQTEDGTAYDASVVGYDTRTDVGVLGVKGTAFTPAEFGDSTKLQVGEPVYAIGNPGGTEFYGSFTSGVVSALDRPTSSESGYTLECIQHDAAINSGNSGGALINSYGQVVGINSSKIMEEGYEGMGFAVPISVAKDVVDDIMETGYVKNRAKLGIQYVAVSENQTYAMVAQMNNLPDGSVVIAKIGSGSPLEGTDVQAGDIITQVNGKNLDKTSVLLDAIESASPGDELELTIARVDSNYKTTTSKVKVKLIEDKGTAESSESGNENGNGGGFTNPFSKQND